MATIQSTKSALRKSMKQRLSNISAESITLQSQNVFKHVVEHPIYVKSRSVACYLSMANGEIQTDAIVRAALADGKALYVPRIMKTISPSGAKGSFMDFFRIHSEEDFEENLESGVWGIREPKETHENQPRSRIFSEGSSGVDLILMPGMAFDRDFSRLGHGKGYYDKFIAEYKALAPSRAWKVPALCGISLEEQVLEAGTIPMTETDVHLDFLITIEDITSSKDARNSVTQ